MKTKNYFLLIVFLLDDNNCLFVNVPRMRAIVPPTFEGCPCVAAVTLLSTAHFTAHLNVEFLIDLFALSFILARGCEEREHAVV